MLVVWSVFAATALRQPGTWEELRVGVLEEVAPARARRRRRDSAERLVRSTGFPVFGLATWGPRHLQGWSSASRPGERPRVTSVGLEFAPAVPAGPRVQVETRSDERRPYDDVEQRLADELFDWALRASAPPSGDALEHWAARDRARAAWAVPRWEDGTLDVAGQVVPARRLVEGDSWVAHTRVGSEQVVVLARGIAPEDLPPLVVADLAEYPMPEPMASGGGPPG